MTPLRVEIILAEPIVPGSFPSVLDGLLACCAVEDALMLADDLDDARPLRSLAESLPLARESNGDLSVWKASAWMPVGRVTAHCELDDFSVSGQTHSRRLTRKSDVFEISRLTGEGFIAARGFDVKNPAPYGIQMDTARGLLKGALMTYSLKDVHAIEAWCIGDRDAIETLLLSHVEFIGAKRRLGHGRVREIRVIEDDRANSLWALRPLPPGMEDVSSAAACSNRVPLRIPVAAPYWDTRYSIEQLAPAAMFW